MGIFKTNCKFCGTRIAVDDIYAGARAHCPGCGRIIDLTPPDSGAPMPPANDLGSKAAELASRPSRPPEQPQPAVSGPAPGVGETPKPALSPIERVKRTMAGKGGDSPLGRFWQGLLDYLFFRRMIFRVWAIFVSLLVTLFGLIAAVVLFCMGRVTEGFITLGAVIVIRFLNEWCLVIFSINDNLTEIRNSLKK